MFSVIGDYNGVREETENKETYLKIYLDGTDIMVDFKDGWCEGFVAILSKLQNGSLSEVVFSQLPIYGRMFDSWEGGEPLVRPSDPI